MPDPAERIQPEQDYADRLAAAIYSEPTDPASLVVLGETLARVRKETAALIRSTLREEATEAWAVQAKGTYIFQLLQTEPTPKYVAMQKRLGYTVRRVLVLEDPRA